MHDRDSAPLDPIPGRQLLWIGPTTTVELALARRWAGELTDVVDVATPADAIAAPPPCFLDRSPTAVLLASATPAQWTLADCVMLSRRWPLAPLVSVAAPLSEGRRRSGPPLPGVEEMPWSDLPGRLAWWLLDRRRGRPGGLGMPTTARRDERLLEAADRVAEFAAWRGCRVSVAASRAIDVEGVADMLAAAGRTVVRRTCGRPALDEPADVLVWDVAAVSAADLTWLGMLTANRPGLAVILLDSFPRGETVLAGLRAGARAVLARPVSLEALTGVLLGLEQPTAAA
ncbi:MAG: hypothetical protein ACR2IT_12790 [Pirellulales bacterium]